ncbi:MAG: phosphate acetyltransferase [Oscillospiraceae bacterium]|nr:phosphate acetyltransferase [Oscillospiraceae bacterium]
MFNKLKAQLKASPKTCVLPEGVDYRILSAAERLTKEGLMGVILVGNVDDVKAAAAKDGYDISGAQIIDPETYEGMDAMVEKMVELRKGKMSAEDCRKNLMSSNYFGTMLVKMGLADCLLGGATYSTADTIRPALQLIKTKPGSTIVSSCFILARDGKDGQQELLAMGDCAVNIHPTEDNMIEIAQETAAMAVNFGIDPKIAFLSFSTKGSAKDDEVTKMANAAARAKEIIPYPCDGEMQFDAAVNPEVGQRKFPGSPVAGNANTFIFPDVTSGNIGYKIAARLGGFEAYGPILLGLNAPINDLSRGCNAEEVYKMAIITAAIA